MRWEGKHSAKRSVRLFSVDYQQHLTPPFTYRLCRCHAAPDVGCHGWTVDGTFKLTVKGLFPLRCQPLYATHTYPRLHLYARHLAAAYTPTGRLPLLMPVTLPRCLRLPRLGIHTVPSHALHPLPHTTLHYHHTPPPTFAAAHLPHTPTHAHPHTPSHHTSPPPAGSSPYIVHATPGSGHRPPDTPSLPYLPGTSGFSSIVQFCGFSSPFSCFVPCCAIH